VPTKIDIETADAFSRRASFISTVRPSSLRSFWSTLVPPETRRRIGTPHVGSTEVLSTPRVTERTSAKGTRGSNALLGTSSFRVGPMK
jgi:hypothetical protein